MWFRSRGPSETEFRQEIEAHVVLEAERLAGEGLSRGEAERRARAAFGSRTGSRERYRESRRLAWLDTLQRDLRHALRSLRHDPRHALAGAGSLGLGLSSALATFAVVNGLFLGPIPGVVARSTLAALHIEESFLRGGSSIATQVSGVSATLFVNVSADDVEWLQRQVPSLPLVAEARMDLAVMLGSESIPVTVAFVSGAYFEALGTQPSAGRLLSMADSHAAASVGVVSARFRSTHLADAWQRSLIVAGHPVGIVGAAQADFAGAGFINALHEDFAPIDLWIPMESARTWPVSFGAVDLAVRLPGDLTQDEATERLQAAVASLPSRDPGPRLAHLQALGHPRNSTPAGLALFLAAMMIAPLIVVGVACANVAHLRLARASAQVHELGVRMALGSNRGQLVRLLLAESLVLATAGTFVGALGGWMLVQLLAARWPLPVHFDLRVAGFTAALLASVTILTGLMPALMTTRRLMRAGLRDTRRSGGPAHSRFRHNLVAVQVALSLALLVVATLLVRSARDLAADQPSASRELLVVDVDVSELTYGPSATEGLARDLAVRVAADSRVRAVGYSDQSLFCCTAEGSIAVLPPGESTVAFRADLARVSPEWFDATGVETLAGSTLTGDASDAVVDARFAAEITPSGSPIGMSVRLRPRGMTTSAEDVPVRITGIVSEAIHRPRAAGPDPRIYLPLVATADGGAVSDSFTLFVRTEDPPALQREVGRLIADLEPRGPLTRIRMASDILADELYLNRTAAAAASAVSLLALVLAATGLYAAVGYVVALRAREIGVRQAVGATPGRVVALVVRQALMLTVPGIVAGVVLVLPATRILQASIAGMLFLDPASVLLSVLFLLAVAAIAVAHPVASALGVDPGRVLRTE